MFDTEPKIITAFGVGQREAKLVITNHDYPPLEEGQRYKLVRAEDGLSLRLLPERWDHWIVSIWKKVRRNL